ncbi:M15 family metallopeptidase [Thalassotalea sp. G2M2-11]|uniref:M15 family metallopeptidase n=1 Tax=Thalassotalea sp. G2M2-11 TaxID=2787627 RepID=UPI0019CFE7B9|nr:M15 family metallopeptidase [Thalassotalea sp. G2M2-11]
MKNLLVLFYCFACVSLAHDIPKQFVDLSDVLPDAHYDIRYASTNNFVGEKIKGYHAAKCIIHQDAAKALTIAANELKKSGYRFNIFDCYRPERAVGHFMAWAQDLSALKTKAEYFPNLAKSTLVPDYIAAKSGHSRGYTIDLSLEKKQPDGSYQPVDMGSPFDLFDTLSNTEDPRITPQQSVNRQLLKSVMLNHGFTDYSLEWWHFTHSSDPRDRYWDFEIR